MIKGSPHQDRLIEIADELKSLFPDDETVAINSWADDTDEPDTAAAHAAVNALDSEGLMNALRTARRSLLLELITQEYHEHMLDDCGDDLEAVSFSWQLLHDAYFMNDGEADDAIRAALHRILDEGYHETPARPM